MNVLVAGLEMNELPRIAGMLDQLDCVTCVFAGEDDVLQALAFAHFDAMVLDLDEAPHRAIEMVKLHRFAALGEPPLPVVGLASRMTPFLNQSPQDGVIDRLLRKPIAPADLHSSLKGAVAEMKRRKAG